MLEQANRRSLIVYLHYNRDARKLNKYGDPVYHSRRLRYLILYLEEERMTQVVEELSKLKFVKKVLASHLADIDQHFVGTLTDFAFVEKLG